MKIIPPTDHAMLEIFAAFIADRWTSHYPHGYDITHHSAWHDWRTRHDGRSVPWSCTSLADAARNWCWTAPAGQPSFAWLAEQLQLAIATDDQALALDICLKIYKWGGVAKKEKDASRVWVTQLAAAGQLTSDLATAVALLAPSASQSLARFHAADLLMTSATTKLYAAAATDGQVTIYDGRVGAALGLLARQFLELHDIDHVPPTLQFMWGPPQSPAQMAARTRDASSDRHKFSQLPNGSRSHLPRAHLSRVTNRLLNAVRMQLAAAGVTASLLDMERALFMIGYRVR